MKRLPLFPISFISLVILFCAFPLFASANWVKISNNPIVSIGSNNTWDQSKVGSASVIVDGSIFKMWYEGNDGSNWRIGYATSNNGITWTKNQTYLIDKIDNFSNTNVHDPKAIFQNNKYKMWFAASNQNIKEIHINYSESSDGIFWSQPLLNVIPVSLTWENDSGISFPFTIFLNNSFKMWFAARGSFNGSTKWRIGYATSTDGITWDKHSTPVLESTQPWEGADVGNPSVLLDETSGIYEMFYHGNGGIGRATSTDGLNWVKDPSNPILIPTFGTFDSQRVFNPFVLKKDGIYYMWYTGISSDGKWQMGLATSVPIPTPLPTTLPTTLPTVTPTPTLTPIPTISPTPTASVTPTITPTLTPTLTTTPTPTLFPTITSTPSPTPTISPPFSPIIIIPGLGASWNPKDIFSCDIKSSGKWDLAPYVSLYNRLIKTLTENAHLRLNKDVYVYTYDWRQPLDIQAENFKNYLENVLREKSPETKVRLVGHSLGGMIIRSYLDHNPNSHHVLSVMTVGSPHLGSLAVYPIWEKGDISIDDLLFQITINQVITNCKVIRIFILPQKSIPVFKFRTSREIVQYFIPVMKQFLPVFDYLRQNGQIKKVNQLKAQNDWIGSHPFPQNNYNISFSTLSGDNNPTLKFFDVTNPSIRESAYGDWVDGKPIGNEKIDSGDGTILNTSSQLEGVNNEKISGNHGEIISSATGITKILNFLGITGIPIAPAVILPEETAKTALMISLDQPVKIKITDPKGNTSETKENISVSFNPM
ncbi:alpha/beta fold hydrolase, partial [Candidatus Gottesmanbacteria bacterium]|nr:alpha/beta fold hydrolase [Candidatus Gottesmanbacteria bacterium]